jgi:transposase
MPRTRPPYPPKFRRQAVELIRSGTALKQVAAELGVSEQTLRNWRPRRDVDAGRAEGLTTDECEELRRLRRENRRLAQQREIRKAAAAFFARRPIAGDMPRTDRRDEVTASRLPAVQRSSASAGRLLRAIGGRARFVGLRGSAAGALARAQFPAGRRAGLGLATRPSAAYLDGHEPARQLAVGPVRPVKARKTGPR